MTNKHFITFRSLMVIAWALGTLLFIYFWPYLAYNQNRKAIVTKGFGDSPILVNTLYTEPQALFAEPLAAQSVLVIGSVLVYRDSGLPTAYDLAKRIRLTQPSQQ